MVNLIFIVKKKKGEIKVIIVIRKNFISKIIVKYQINLVSYLYFILLKIFKLD